MKLFYFDVETTGVKFWKNGIHQISGLIEVDGEIVERFNYLVKPYKDAIIEPEAMTIGNVTAAQIALYPPMEQVHKKLTTILACHCNKFEKQDKYFMVGYNSAAFDCNFLRAFFTQCNDKYFGSFFWSASIDVMVLAMEHLKHRRHLMENFKLHTVAKELGISIDESKLHDAEYDIEITREIYKLITKSK